MGERARLVAVGVIRRGTALALHFAAGPPRVLRRCDLAAALGDAGLTAARFTDAAIPDERDDVLVELASGERQRLDAAALGLDPPAAAAPEADLVITGARVLTALRGAGDDPDDRLGVLGDAAVVCAGPRVAWIGPASQLGRCGVGLDRARRLDAAGRLLTPGLVDCHAHPLFAGDRADEFGLRAAGASYLEIAAAGGGIQASLGPTRAASFDQLAAVTAARLTRALAAGTTTMEAKSGYDLTVGGELRLLEVAQVLDALLAIDLEPTLLGAHVVPDEYRGDRAGYVAAVADAMVPRAIAAGLATSSNSYADPAAPGLATSVDIYCDQGAFDLDETRLILTAARRAGLGVRAHAGQFADLGAAELVAALGGWSADHLEHVSAAGITALAAAGTVAVMLPGACVQLRLTPPPVAALRAAGVAMAVATDLNPGSSMCESLPVQMWLATTHYGMTVEEAWLGVTAHAARALGPRPGRAPIGRIAAGAAADLVLWDAERPAEIPYHYGGSAVAHVFKAGREARPAGN